jgi:hypothetical protein
MKKGKGGKAKGGSTQAHTIDKYVKQGKAVTASSEGMNRGGKKKGKKY